MPASAALIDDLRPVQCHSVSPPDTEISEMRTSHIHRQLLEGQPEDDVADDVRFQRGDLVYKVKLRLGVDQVSVTT